MSGVPKYDKRKEGASKLHGRSFIISYKLNLKKNLRCKGLNKTRCQTGISAGETIRTVFYRKGEAAPVRTTKLCKTRGKFYKEWIRPFHEYQPGFIPPCEISGYTFKKGQDYLVCCGSTFSYYEIVPEVARREDFQKVLHSTELCEYMWNLEPVDLSESWDYSEEEKDGFREKFREIDEQRMKNAEELERMKATPGFCDVCGAPAEYVEDPYAYEMYGTHNMVWLCPDCYHDACMDV